VDHLALASSGQQSPVNLTSAHPQHLERQNKKTTQRRNDQRKIKKRKNNSKKEQLKEKTIKKSQRKNERQKTPERKDGKLRSFLYSIAAGNSHFAEPSIVVRASNSSSPTFLPCVKDLKT